MRDKRIMMNGFFDEIGGPDLEEFMEFMFVTGQLETGESDSCDDSSENTAQEEMQIKQKNYYSIIPLVFK